MSLKYIDNTAKEVAEKFIQFMGCRYWTTLKLINDFINMKIRFFDCNPV